MIFKFTEGSFDAPAQLVDLLDLFDRKFFVLKVSDKSFVIINKYFYSYDPEFERICLF